MRGIARILGILGAVLVVAGFVGPIFGLAGFNVFPGIVLLFISRVMLKQAQQAERTAPPVDEPDPAHPLNTERRRAAPPPPRPKQPPVSRPTPPKPPPAEPAVKVEEQAERGSIFESILIAGGELAEEKETGSVSEGMIESGDYEPMTSAEMIARARRRWDRKP